MKVLADSLLARVFLAFLTTAGIFYINIMPAVINSLKQALHFTNQEAGFVSSANLYGAATGALLAVFLIKHINWKRWSYSLLMALIAIDLACILIDTPIMMITVRAFHGVTGGLLVGIGFAIISRTTEADKTFGYLLLIQFGLGGLGIMYLPGLVPEYGISALFISLATFTTVTLMMLPFLDDYAVSESAHDEQVKVSIKKGYLGLNLMAIFLFQAANMGLFAYMIGISWAYVLPYIFLGSAQNLIRRVRWSPWVVLHQK